MNTHPETLASPNPIPLSQENLALIPNNILKPQYDRNALSCGILHMSVGGFHRSHQALYMDRYLSKTSTNWMICAVGLLPQDKENIEALQRQDNLYSVLERDGITDTLRIVGSIKETIHAPSHPEKIKEKLIDPDIKIVSLTVTEKGYYYDENGDLDFDHPSIKNDLDSPESPQTIYGYILLGLALRRKNGASAFTIMSCDNLPGNGDLAKKLILQFANKIDPDLAQWIKDNVKFPNAMVDRITPVTTNIIKDIVRDDFNIEDEWPVVCEDYLQWVLEDKFTNKERPELEKVGVQIVEDVEPYEKMKVRLLNGSHSALAYLSYLIGYRDVDKAMADSNIREFVERYMDHDITPSVPDVPGIDLDYYKQTLIKRFSNPAIADQIQRLAEDGSQKIPNAILPCILYQLKNGGSIKYACFALAAWFTYLTGKDEKLEPIEINDPMSEKFQNALSIDPLDLTRILSINEIFGSELPVDASFLNEIHEARRKIHELGTEKALSELLE